MALLLFSIALLWAAPWLYDKFRMFGKGRVLIERVLLVLLASVLLFKFLPDSIRLIGLNAILVMALGMLLPSMLERAWHKLARQVHWFPLMAGILGLALHALLDGAAFIEPDSLHENSIQMGSVYLGALSFAVILHRFFEGLFVWLLLRPRVGAPTAVAALVTISIFSLIGYYTGEYFARTIENARLFGTFQAVVAGSLLHLVFDPHTPGRSSKSAGHNHHSHSHHHH